MKNDSSVHNQQIIESDRPNIIACWNEPILIITHPPQWTTATTNFLCIKLCPPFSLLNKLYGNKIGKNRAAGSVIFHFHCSQWCQCGVVLCVVAAAIRRRNVLQPTNRTDGQKTSCKTSYLSNKVFITKLIRYVVRDASCSHQTYQINYQYTYHVYIWCVYY